MGGESLLEKKVGWRLYSKLNSEGGRILSKKGTLFTTKIFRNQDFIFENKLLLS